MASELEIALGLFAPFYNLIFAAIALLLFIKLLRRPNNIVYTKPWKVIFIAFCIYVIEEVFTVLRNLGVLNFPQIVNGIFEMIIISLFIYMLFMQKEYLKKTHHLKTRDEYREYHRKERQQKFKKNEGQQVVKKSERRQKFKKNEGQQVVNKNERRQKFKKV